MPGILKTFVGPYLLEAEPMGDISTPWVIKPACQEQVLSFLHNE